MKITIDTKEDSHAEIRNIIKMLSSLVGEKEVMSTQGDMFSDDDQGSSAGIFNMFSDSGNSENNDDTEDEIKIEPREEKKEDKAEIDLDIPELEEYDD